MWQNSFKKNEYTYALLAKNNTKSHTVCTAAKYLHICTCLTNAYTVLRALR